MLHEIAAAKNVKTLTELYQRYKKSPILNSRRHPTWDKFCTFFTGPTYTKSKIQIIQALQETFRRIP